jgi:hypothetical protein
MEIKKSDIKKWVKALRSGEYSQCRDQLQTTSGHCCLGVACEVFIRNPIRENRLLKGVTPEEQLFAPKWLKQINDDFDKKVFGDRDWMIEKLNDREQLTFDEIADCLEAVYIHEVMS